MANRPPTKIISPKIRPSQPPQSTKPTQSNEKTVNIQKSTPDVFSRFLKNFNYEYFRREFSSVKEKFKEGNQPFSVAKRSPEVKKLIPQYVPCTSMASIQKSRRVRRSGGGYKLFVLKSLIGMITIYSSVRLGIWGTSDETQKLATKFSATLRDGEFHGTVQNVSNLVVECVKDWSQNAANFVQSSANYLKDKFRKEK